MIKKKSLKNFKNLRNIFKSFLNFVLKKKQIKLYKLKKLKKLKNKLNVKKMILLYKFLKYNKVFFKKYKLFNYNFLKFYKKKYFYRFNINNDNIIYKNKKRKLIRKERFWKKSKKFKRRKFLINRSLNLYLKKILKRNKLNLKNDEIKQRFFFYDFFLNKFNEKIYLAKYGTFLNLLWQKKINNTFFRYRLSEYMFLYLNNLKCNKLILNNKFYYILSFYKIVVLLKKKLIFFKNLFRKKYFKNYKKLNIKLKKIYIIQQIKKKKIYILKYYTMLKYFNKFFFFFFSHLNLNVQKIIEKKRSFVYLSFVLNLAIDQKKYVSLVSINNYFMQKTNNYYFRSLLINDKIYNYINVLETGLKKDLYWNFASPYGKYETFKIMYSYLMIPVIKNSVNLKSTFFFGVKEYNNLKKNFNNYIFFKLYFNYLFLKKKFFKQIYKLNINLNLLLNLITKNIYMFLKLFFILKIGLNMKKNLLLSKNNLYFFKKKFLNIKKNILYFFVNLYFFLYYTKFFFKKFNFLFFCENFISYFFKLNNNFFLFNEEKNINFFKNIKKKNFNLRKFFLDTIDNYYSIYSRRNKRNQKKCVLHLIEKKSNNFLVLSLFKDNRVIGHTSSGQGLYRAYYNSKRQKKGTRVLTKIIYRKLRLRARKYGLKEVILKANLYWNYRIKFLTKYWVLRYKLGVPHVIGVKLGLGLPYHKGLRYQKKKRK